MMTIKQYYLVKLAEECAEVAQRAMKSAQFGGEQIQTGQELTNCQRLSNELNDLLTVMSELQDRNEVITESHEDWMYYYREKSVKIKQYLTFSQSLGMVEND